MFGLIGFENHRIRCIIGLNPHERLEEQEISIDLKIEVDFSQVALKDDLSLAICYESLANFCTELAQKGQYKMLETLAYELIRQLADRYKTSWIKVFIKKPSAIPTASFALVELEYGTRRVKS